MNIVVTGSSTGIGRALVLRLLGESHNVWGMARSDQSSFGTPERGTFHSSRCDVANWPEVEKAFAQVSEKWNTWTGSSAARDPMGRSDRLCARTRHGGAQR